MKNLKTMLYLIAIISLSACGSSTYDTGTDTGTTTPIEITTGDENIFTNIFTYSETDIENIVNIYNIKTSTGGIYSNEFLATNLRRTFADFFFYNQVVMLHNSSTGQYGIDAQKYLLDDIIKPLSSEESGYWSYDQMLEVNSSLSGMDFINGFAPMELPQISEIVLKLALSIDEYGYIDESVGRVLVGLVTSEGIISLRLDISSDMIISSGINSKTISANFSDSCANVYFNGTLKTTINGELEIEDVNLSFINASNSYKNLSCNYSGTLPTYSGVSNLPMGHLNIPYTNSGTTSSTNIAPHDLVYSMETNTKKRVLFDEVKMIETKE